MASGEHRESLQPDVLLAFLDRHPEHGPVYVLDTVRMLEQRFPADLPALLPRLREIYAAKAKAEKSRRS